MIQELPRTVASDPPKAEGLFEPPGGVLVWIIVFIEVVTFGAGLGVFLAQARELPAEFESGRALLNKPLALVNTLILLTGGWCMANSLASLRQGKNLPAWRWIVGAMGTGGTFLILKGIEYSEKFAHGVSFGNDTFFTMYFALTGFHLIHVLVAVLLLSFMARGIRRGSYHGGEHQDVESSAIFWHMCDLIWLLVYPIIYLL